MTVYPNLDATPSHLQRNTAILLHHHTWPRIRTETRRHHTCRETVQYYYTITRDRVPEPRRDVITPAEKHCNITTPSHVTVYPNWDATSSHLQRNSAILLHHHTWPCTRTKTRRHHTCRETLQYYYTITRDRVPKLRGDAITPAEKHCNITTPSHATVYRNLDATSSHLQRNTAILLHHHTWPCTGT